MKYLLFIFILLTHSQCSKKTCEIKKVERIQAIKGGNNGFISYYHEVLMEGLSSSCLDSLIILNLVAKYMDTADFKPIGAIGIFRSKSGYDPGETLSQPKEYNDNEILSIDFYQDSTLPKEFSFYRKGKIIYEGRNWMK
ncbi:MAG: hypothetical protein KF746_11950 [Chitinophagaceae bacterium]|nr:hypothetical protein [Chitinophagaceae bacterium]